MLPNIVFPEVPNGAQSVTGQVSMNEINELQKALTAGYGTDVASLTGGSALRIQSLEKTMLSTIQENKHFRLFNTLAKSNATATVDEWTEQSGVGGFLGGSTNTETGTINEATGDYARQVGQVKYLMTRRQVSLVSTLNNNIVEAEAVEQRNGSIQLLSDAEFLCFEGDAAVVPTEFSGIYAQIKAGVDAGQIGDDHIIDMQGASLNDVTKLNDAAAVIAGFGNFGTPTDIFMSLRTQADFDSGLDPAFRVALDNSPNSISLGTPVRGIRTSHGDIKTNPDVFIPDGDHPASKPFQVTHAALATANDGLKPASLAVDATVSDASSQFTAARAGNYYWMVTGLNAAGQSTGVISSQTAVAAGKKVTLTITASAGGQETGYAIYRSRLNGTNDPSDFRLMARVPKAGATTTYTDLNRDIPGTAKAYVLNLTPGDMAITWRQFLPMMKFPLYPTVSAVIPWAQLLFGFLRIGKRKHHVVFKNIVPNGALWKPFG